MTNPDMRTMVAGLGRQLEWCRGLDRPPSLSASDLVVCGMGGSGIVGDFLAALAAPAGWRVTVHKTFGLPGWVRALPREAMPAVVALSYSGNTAETLSAVAEAKEFGLEVAVVTTGGALAETARANRWVVVTVPEGLQPRAALGYLLGGALRVAEASGAVPDALAQLDEAAGVVETLVEPDRGAWGMAADLAAGLFGRVVAVYGSSGLTAPPANRWKTQINENAKRPAFWAPLPELDHNEVVGWSALARLTRRRFGLVHLRHSGDHPRVALRFDVTAEVTAADVDLVGEVWAEGESTLARLVSLLVVADLVSLELARQEAVDPMPVTAIDILKERLSRETSEE